MVSEVSSPGAVPGAAPALRPWSSPAAAVLAAAAAVVLADFESLPHAASARTATTSGPAESQRAAPVRVGNGGASRRLLTMGGAATRPPSSTP